MKKAKLNCRFNVEPLARGGGHVLIPHILWVLILFALPLLVQHFLNFNSSLPNLVLHFQILFLTFKSYSAILKPSLQIMFSTYKTSSGQILFYTFNMANSSKFSFCTSKSCSALPNLALHL